MNKVDGTLADLKNELGLSHPFPQIKWEPPEELKEELLPVEPFRTEMLPAPLQAWAKDIAERKDNGPVDFAGVSAIVVLGSLLGSKTGIYPKRQDDWLVTPNLWGAIIGRPSLKKTPILADIMKPIQLLEKEARKEHDKTLKEFAVSFKVDEFDQHNIDARAKKLVKEGKRSDAEALLLDAENEKSDVPTRKRYVLNDATVEKIGEILSQNTQGILVVRDELSGLLLGLQREDRAADRAFYLESWNGSGHYTYDRIGRGTIDIPSLTISLLGGIQPGKLAPILQAQREGHGDDGLVERFQMMVYPDQGRFKHVDRWPDKEARAQAEVVFNRFNEIPMPEDEVIGQRFDGEAQDFFDAWYCELMERIGSNRINPRLEAHLAKYPSLFASLALIIHIAEYDGDSPVSLSSAQKAAAWCEYLESHASRVYAIGDDPYLAAKSLAKRLKHLPNPFTMSDFRKRDWEGLKESEDRHTALNELVKRHYLKAIEEDTKGRPKIKYYINPELLEVDNG